MVLLSNVLEKYDIMPRPIYEHLVKHVESTTSPRNFKGGKHFFLVRRPITVRVILQICQ